MFELHQSMIDSKSWFLRCAASSDLQGIHHVRGWLHSGLADKFGSWSTSTVDYQVHVGQWTHSGSKTAVITCQVQQHAEWLYSVAFRWWVPCPVSRNPSGQFKCTCKWWKVRS